jgi:thiol:disulfide interchange protein DsbA
MRIVVAFVLAVLSAACSRATELEEGRDYTVIETGQPAAPTDKTAKIAVTEFFSYQCPHCFAFSAALRDWSAKLPADVQFDRESVAIGHAPWIPIARTYYTLRTMGKLDALDEKIFNAIHKQSVHLDDVAYIMGWLNVNHVPPTDFDAAYRSQRVRDDFARGEKLSVDYKVPSIPAMVVDGKYMVIIKSNVDFGEQLAIIDKLIARVRLAKANQK